MQASVKSARRVLEVLQFFAEHQDAATANEVRAGLGYPQSSTSVLLHSLVKLGYLAHDPVTRRFRPTIRVALLGDWIVDEAGQDSSPPAIMRRLRAATGDCVVLGAQQGVAVAYLQVLQATNPVRFYMKPGALRPLCSTAVGRALLSLRPNDEIAAIVRRINAERAAGTSPLVPAEIIADVERGRHEGFFRTSGTATPGAGVVALPMAGLRDHPPLAIGIGAPIERIEQELDRFVALLREEIDRSGSLAGDLPLASHR